jgi:hypothetical protein
MEEIAKKIRVTITAGVKHKNLEAYHRLCLVSRICVDGATDEFKEEHLTYLTLSRTEVLKWFSNHRVLIH